ncbi:hypothetical protein NPX98_06265, partial [Bartonella sp. A5(2022)]|nr:hypothetical protein [Bartonella sp. A05]
MKKLYSASEKKCFTRCLSLYLLPSVKAVLVGTVMTTFLLSVFPVLASDPVNPAITKANGTGPNSPDSDTPNMHDTYGSGSHGNDNHYNIEPSAGQAVTAEEQHDNLITRASLSGIDPSSFVAEGVVYPSDTVNSGSRILNASSSGNVLDPLGVMTREGRDFRGNGDEYQAGGGNAVGDNAISIGRESQALGKDAIAIGIQAKAQGDRSFAIGYQANTGLNLMYARSSIHDGISIGAGSISRVDSGIALGSYAVADRASGVKGYVPGSITIYSTLENMSVWKSTLGALTIGGQDHSTKKVHSRQITGVAAGSELTDAVNVAQLKELEKLIRKGASVPQESGTNNLLIQQDQELYRITIGSSTEEAEINIANSKKENRIISGLKNGKISEQSTEAVNGALLYSIGDDLAKSFGGNAKYDDGTWIAPTFKVSQVDANGTISAEKYYTNISDAFSGVNESFGKVGIAIKGVNNKVTQVETIAAKVEGEVKGVRREVKVIEDKVQGVDNKVTQVEDEIKDIFRGFVDTTVHMTIQEVKQDALLWDKDRQGFVAVHGSA